MIYIVVIYKVYVTYYYDNISNINIWVSFKILTDLVHNAGACTHIISI